MIIITTEPATLSPVKNPLSFIVEADNYIIQEGTKPSLTLEKVGEIVEEEGLLFPAVLGYFDTGVAYSSMTGRTSPEDKPWALTISGTISQHILDLLKNYYINKNYNVTLVDATHFKIEYKNARPANEYPCEIFEIGSAYSLTNYVEGLENEVQENFKIIALLFIEPVLNSGTYEQFEFIADVDENGSSEIQFNDFVNSFFISRDLPTFGQLTDSSCSHVIKKYYFKFADYLGNVNSIGSLIPSSVKYLINAKLPFMEFPTITIEDWLTNTNNYLTLQPSSLKTSEQTPHYLYYLHIQASAVVYPVYTVYYDDGTSATVNGANYTIALYETRIIVAGYAVVASKFSIPSGKKIYKYTISVYNKTTEQQVGKLQTYFLDYRHYTQVDFLFENQFGVFETLMCKGNIESKLQTGNSIFQKNITPDYIATDGEFVNNEEDSFEEFSAYTGFYEKDFIDNLKNLFVAKTFYLVDADNSQYIPCKLTSSNFEISNTQNNLFSVKFEYRYAFNK